MKKALFIRLDRMGDLVLTLPCDQLVAKTHQVHWVIPKGLDFVPKSAAPQREFSSFNKDWNLQNFKKFYSLVRKIKPDVSISFHVPWWINFCLWLARVRVRGGVQSQWHSYLFLNKGLRQKRSRCEHHEMEYNFLLTEFVFDKASDSSWWQPVKLSADENKELAFNTNQDYFVVHPGMGGSAINWSTNNYTDLINQLSKKATIVITGTQSDEPYLQPLKLALKENHKVVWLDKQLSGDQLLILLKHAKANIAPSTGVLHLSASLGATSLGIYSPIKVHQDKRWGPKGEKATSFSPSADCPAHFECIGESCPHFNCMAKMPTSPVVQKATQSL